MTPPFLNVRPRLALPHQSETGIRSLSEFIDVVGNLREKETQLFDDDHWYRGQPRTNKKWLLLPSVFRERVHDSSVPNEQRINDEFMQYHEHHLQKNLEPYGVSTLGQMRHLGVPTRLIDWTLNPLIALFFAVWSGDSTMKFDGPTVWLLRPRELNAMAIPGVEGRIGAFDDVFVGARAEIITVNNALSSQPKDQREDVNKLFKKLIDKVKALGHVVEGGADVLKTLRLPYAFSPKYGDSARMIAQDSRFTIHGTSEGSLEEILGWNARYEYCPLTKIPIDPDCVAGIRDELAKVGVHARRVFPDQEGLVLQLSEIRSRATTPQDAQWKDPFADDA